MNIWIPRPREQINLIASKEAPNHKCYGCDSKVTLTCCNFIKDRIDYGYCRHNHWKIKEGKK
jgi:hypothetical protein